MHITITTVGTVTFVKNLKKSLSVLADILILGMWELVSHYFKEAFGKNEKIHDENDKLITPEKK